MWACAARRVDRPLRQNGQTWRVTCTAIGSVEDTFGGIEIVVMMPEC
jgi:hypothetical protein